MHICSKIQMVVRLSASERNMPHRIDPMACRAMPVSSTSWIRERLKPFRLNMTVEVAVTND
jgi:hypothetical protein